MGLCQNMSPPAWVWAWFWSQTIPSEYCGYVNTWDPKIIKIPNFYKSVNWMVLVTWLFRQIESVFRWWPKYQTVIKVMAWKLDIQQQHCAFKYQTSLVFRSSVCCNNLGGYLWSPAPELLAFVFWNLKNETSLHLFYELFKKFMTLKKKILKVFTESSLRQSYTGWL